jgi:hypothetical protein
MEKTERESRLSQKLAQIRRIVKRYQNLEPPYNSIEEDVNAKFFDDLNSLLNLKIHEGEKEIRV